MGGKVLTFGSIRFDQDSRAVICGGMRVSLGQRATAILERLLMSGGDVVSKSDLIEHAWPDTVVEEANLSVQVAALRKALSVTSEGRDIITTMPGRGYRLAPFSVTAARDVLRPSLAVVPFRNLSSDPDQSYFVDGVVDDIISALTKFRSFSVIARGSSFTFRDQNDTGQIARELGVRYILTGSLRRSIDKIRIHAELIDTESAKCLWSDRFEGEVQEVFEFQERIAECVVLGMAPELTASETEKSLRLRPKSLDSYDVYLKAIDLLSREREDRNREAMALIETALKDNPDDAYLLAAASFAIEHRLTTGWPAFGDDDRLRCGDYARRALATGLGDPLIMAHCGISLMQGARDYEWAIPTIDSAYAGNPNHAFVVIAFGIMQLHCGDLDVALGCFDRCRQLSPRDPFAYVNLCAMAHAHLVKGDFGAAKELAGSSLALRPTFEMSLIMLIAATSQLGDTETSRRALETLLGLMPDATVEKFRSRQPDYHHGRMDPIWDGLERAGLPVC